MANRRELFAIVTRPLRPDPDMPKDHHSITIAMDDDKIVVKSPTTLEQYEQRRRGLVAARLKHGVILEGDEAIAEELKKEGSNGTLSGEQEIHSR